MLILQLVCKSVCVVTLSLLLLLLLIELLGLKLLILLLLLRRVLRIIERNIHELLLLLLLLLLREIASLLWRLTSISLLVRGTRSSGIIAIRRSTAVSILVVAHGCG